jgi:hypothetical protein
VVQQIRSPETGDAFDAVADTLPRASWEQIGYPLPKGTSVPLAVVAEFEPVIGADGGPRLLARSAFQIDLRTFDIEGADGPEPAKYTLLLDVNLKRKPVPGE